jgi:peptide/nickel transport system substrate-binding protein
MEALDPEEGAQLQERWRAVRQGTVYTLEGPAYFLSPQLRPAVQREPAILDVRVRQALYQAIDRDALALREFVLPAWSVMPPNDRLYEATRDGLRRHPFDPARSRAILQELGWSPGGDGILHHSSDGRAFQTTIGTVDSGRLWELATYADAWRRIGVEVEERQTSPAQARDLEFRASYPGWDATSAGQGDALLNRLQGPAASAANRWGGNRGGYEDPAAERLLARYYAGLSEQERFDAMHDISEFVATTLPMLITYYITYHAGVRQGVRALQDMAGWEQSYGTITRNAHLWEID